MPKLLPIISLLTMLCLPVQAEDQDPLLKDRQDQINYSYGHLLGAELLEKQVELRPNAVLQGLYDATFQGELLISQEAMDLLLEQLRDGTLEPEEPEGYRLKGQEFLAKNGKKEGVTALQSGVQYKPLKKGNGKSPGGSDAVLVNYRARTIDGQEIDNSYPLGIPTPAEFKVNKLLPGLTETLKLMQVGDKWEIYLPYTMAYRDSGPMAGQTVIYELELLEILPKYR